MQPRIEKDIEKFKEYVKSSVSFSELAKKLGYEPGSGGVLRMLKRKCIQYEMNIDHFICRRANSGFSKKELEDAVASSDNFSDVARKIGLGHNCNGSAHHKLTKTVKEFGINYSHFTGSRWSVGKTRFENENLKKQAEKKMLPWDMVFCKDSSRGVHSLDIIFRLVEKGVKKYRCEKCNNSIWNEIPIRLQLDHINGDSTDNRIENLRLLCPNCHAQTETFCRGLKPNKNTRAKRKLDFLIKHYS